MKIPSIKSTRGQRGAVLVVALIMLVVSTLLVISMTKTSMLELKIGGADQVYANNFTNAEAAISKFIADNNGRFASGFINLATSSGGVVIDPPTGLVGGTVTLDATQVSCAPSGNTNVLLFDVKAIARGTLPGSVLIMHQGLLTTTKSCGDSACMALNVPQGGAGSAHNTTAQSCNSFNACIHSPQHTNDCSAVCLSSGKDDEGKDCSFTCDVSSKDSSGNRCNEATDHDGNFTGKDKDGRDCYSKDKDGNRCTVRTNPGVTKAYWYVEPEQ